MIGWPAATAARPAAGGRGLLGMREGAELYGGQLSAGPAAEGGYLVSAVIPAPAGSDLPGVA